ncbi:MAG: molecular chaperone HtpG [Chlamydiales bacterium]|jgi:molecular chaperone HtpG
MTTQTETHHFEAEVQEVLNLVIHSLYTNREIFLRELLSNASDALDKLRFESLTRSELVQEGEVLGIALSVDPEERSLCIADNGIGMSHDELVENLGTIANSGTRRFIEALAERKENEGENPDLIGRFGVGFYSSFMVAEHVSVETRKAGETGGWRWSSAGDGQYAIEEVQDLAPGTVVRLKLREGEEFDDFLKEWKLREIVRRYSDFVEYPIQMEVERSEPKRDEKGELIEDAEPEVTRTTETLNSQKPLWSRPKSEIEKSDYDDFYKHLTHDWKDPFDVIHFKAEGTLEYTALLYLPQERSMDMMDPAQRESRISLYTRRVLIQAECEALLPNWLRFVRGVVECSDLPLNVSRETVQDNPQLAQIQKRLVHKVLESAAHLLESERESFEKFWEAFGLILKEGIYHGEDEDQRLSKLCLFHSTHGEGLTTIGEYIGRMPEDQEAIYTITGPALKALESSPHLESLRAKGYEVLFLTDSVDEWIQQRLTEFDGKPIRSVEKGDIDLEDDDDKKAREEEQEQHKDLLESMRDQLSDDLSEVRFSGRLKESAAVLVSAEQSMSPQLLRMLRSSGQEVPAQKRILEINGEHALVRGLKKLHDLDPKTPRLGEVTELLYGQALLGEGSDLEDPARFSKLLTSLLVESVSS